MISESASRALSKIPKCKLTREEIKALEDAILNREMGLWSIVERFQNTVQSRGIAGLTTDGIAYGTDLKKIGDWAANIIRKAVDDPCIDNIRFARYGDCDDMEEYFVKRANGCCGFYDGVHKYPGDGKKYLVGCNYGH